MKLSRLVNYLKEIKQLDNTIIFVVIGDNGASKKALTMVILTEQYLQTISGLRIAAI
jgi:arylsulfatase